MGSINFRVASRVRFSFFEKVGNREGTARLQKSGGKKQKKPCDVLIVGDRFDGPEGRRIVSEKCIASASIKRKLCIESFGFRGLYRHLDLYWGK